MCAERSHFRAKLTLIFTFKVPEATLLDYACQFINSTGEEASSIRWKWQPLLKLTHPTLWEWDEDRRNV